MQRMWGDYKDRLGYITYSDAKKTHQNLVTCIDRWLMLLDVVIFFPLPDKFDEWKATLGLQFHLLDEKPPS